MTIHWIDNKISSKIMVPKTEIQTEREREREREREFDPPPVGMCSFPGTQNMVCKIGVTRNP